MIYHALNWADRTLSAPVDIDTFNEFQLRDIGLTRDQEHIRAHVGDTADPWHWPEEPKPVPVQPAAKAVCSEGPRIGRVSPRAQAGENKDISISLCD
ncbi:hypothetical protein IB267_25410 [Ensifer sp. ENS09]|uniref:hypothetical protein n=1 Tax=Ensifer sp. ENS09 TaxID=2769263 RepID=UPI001782DE2B|nr:hypothetical protein [Ensifer sp. ENS09]MBD9651695.1 hypothetical protein [Ensifer sp. ENS09]